MGKKNKSITLDPSGNNCKHCSYPLVWKEHKEITQKQLRGPFYFKQWESCINCHAVFTHEKDKVYKNAGAKKQFMNNHHRYMQQQEERQQLISFFKGI